MSTTFARSAAEAAVVLARIVADGGKPLLVGGGTLCVPALVRGEVPATDVVDLGRAGLDLVEDEPDGPGLRLGALVTYQQLITSPAVRDGLPVLHRMASGITGGIQIRHQGTLGGSLCAARPQSDAPAVLVALGAEVTVRSAAGSRTVTAADFLTGPGAPGLAPDELVTDLRIPLRPRGAGYVKHKFAESSWPVVTAAAVLPERVVLGGVAGTPLTVPLTATGEAAVRAAVVDRLAALPVERRWSDVRAPWDYRQRVAPDIAVRAVRLAEEAP